MANATDQISPLYSVVAPGQRSDQVKQLQGALIGAGFNIPAGATGFFGPQTQAAVDAWKAKLGTPADQGVNIDVGAGGGTSKFNLTEPTEPSTDLLKSYTSFDDIKKMIDGATIGVNKTLLPTDAEKELKTKLADIRAKQDTLALGEKTYENNLQGEGISSGAIQGRSEASARVTALQLEPLILQEKNLLTRLGLEQDARAIDQKVAENKMTSVKDLISVADKMQQRINEQKTALIAATDKMTDNARQSLQTILSQFQGLDFHSLAPAAQLEVQKIANQIGIPIDVIMKGMDVVKNQQDFENLLKIKQENRLSTESTRGGTDWNSAQQFITDNPNATREELELGIRQNTKLSDGDITAILDTKFGGAKESSYLSDQNMNDVAKALVQGYAGGAFGGSGGVDDAKGAIKTGKIQINGKNVTLSQDQINKISTKIDEIYPQGRTFWQKVLPWGK